MLILFVLATLVALLGPVLAAIILLRRFKIEWQVLLYGMVAYIGADILQRLLSSFLAQAIASAPSETGDVMALLTTRALISGLVMGVIAVLALWLVFRFFRTVTNSWKRALIIGLGYGGVGVIMEIGLTLTFMLVTYFTYQGQDLAAMGLTAEQIPQAQQFLAAFEAQSLSTVFGYLVVSVLQVVLMVLAAILVWYGVSQRRYAWLAAAAAWVAIVTGLQVFTTDMLMLLESDNLLWLAWLAFCGLGVWMIIKSRQKMELPQALE